MFARLKTLPLTIILTFLIWMYAEAEFTSTRDDVAVSVQVQSPDANQWTVRAIDPRERNSPPRRTINLRLSLQGPKAQVERIYQQAIGAAPQADLTFAELAIAPTTAELAAGAETVNAVRALNSLPYFRNKGVTVLSADLERVPLEVDQFRHFTKPVELRTQGVPVTVVTLAPANAEIAVPAKTLKALGGEGKISIIAEPLESLAGAVGENVAAPIKLSAEYTGVRDDRITITPQQGTATLRIQARLVRRFAIPDVPVFVSGPPATLARFTVEVKPERVSLTLAGAPEIIEKLQNTLAVGSPTAAVRVYLDLSLDDGPGPGMIQRRLRYTLPEGVRLEGEQNPVSFRLVEKSAPTQPN